MGKYDEVIEIGIIDDDGKVLIDTLVRPRGKIDPVAASVHGITQEMLNDKPTWDKIWPDIETVLTGRKIGIYNKEFDVNIMKQSHTRSWMRWTLPDNNFFDIMELYARFYGDWDRERLTFRSQALELAGKQCGIPLANTHRAIDDCRLTRALLHYIAEGD
jgi:DNA polymerase-3 subunit epsilon